MDFEAPDWRALHSSVARRRRFAFCPVGYYLYHVAGRDGYAAYSEDWHYRVYAAKHQLSASAWGIELWRRNVRNYFRSGSGSRRRKLETFLRSAFEREFNLLEQRAFERDPKLVHAVREIEDNTISLQQFYEQKLLQLNNIYSAFAQSPLYGELMRLPLSDFRDVESSWQPWQLGSVNFYNPPDLLWKRDRSLQILDMTTYAFRQEQQRAVDLFRTYVYCFMHIPSAAAEVIFFDPSNGEWSCGESSGEDFGDIFRQLYGEAVMWRDYLAEQSSNAAEGKWLHARLENCMHCRFRKLCPAGSGTPEPENSSIKVDS